MKLRTLRQVLVAAHRSWNGQKLQRILNANGKLCGSFKLFKWNCNNFRQILTFGKKKNRMMHWIPSLQASRTDVCYTVQLLSLIVCLANFFAAWPPSLKSRLCCLLVACQMLHQINRQPNIGKCTQIRIWFVGRQENTFRFRTQRSYCAGVPSMSVCVRSPSKKLKQKRSGRFALFAVIVCRIYLPFIVFCQIEFHFTHVPKASEREKQFPNISNAAR